MLFVYLHEAVDTMSVYSPVCFGDLILCSFTLNGLAHSRCLRLDLKIVSSANKNLMYTHCMFVGRFVLLVRMIST